MVAAAAAADTMPVGEPQVEKVHTADSNSKSHDAKISSKPSMKPEGWNQRATGFGVTQHL